MQVKIFGKLRKQGLTELFFESAEPKFDELNPMDFFERFPQGEYEIEGKTLDGEEIEGEVELSHVLPAAPAEIELTYAIECEAPDIPDEDGECEGSTMLPPAVFDDEDDLVCVELEGLAEDGVTINWGEVTMSHRVQGTTAPHGWNLGEDGDINVLYYEVVIETEVGEEGEELEVVSSTLLPPKITEFEFPEAYFEMTDEFKFEILVRDENGNKSATEGCFEISEED